MVDEKNTLDEEKEYENGFKPKEVHLKENYVFYRKNIFYLIWNKIVVFVASFIFAFPKILVYGFKTTGRKNLKHMKGAIIISNHVYSNDVILIISALRHSKTLYQTTVQSNLGFGIVSKIFTGGGAVPIPTDSIHLLRKFNRSTVETLNKNYPILFFPEGHLIPECKRIRPFMSGAFHFAIDSNSKIIIPTVITFHKPKGFYKLTRRNKPCIHYNILEPYHIEMLENKRLTINKISEDLHTIMSDYYLEHSDYFK